MSTKEPYGVSHFSMLSSLLSVLNSNEEDHINVVLAKYMLEHIREIGSLSIYKIADDCFTSRSSIQRFVQHLGFDSFTALKENGVENLAHWDKFIEYADHPDYPNFLSQSVSKMTESINASYSKQSMENLCELIYNSKNVLLLIAETSSSAIREFQQGMIAFGKIMRLMTDSYGNMELITQLQPDDLILVCSVTGNFAMGISSDLKETTAKKALITMNRTERLTNDYSNIFYIGNEHVSRNTIQAVRGVYGRYGLTYYLDLLVNVYLEMYRNKNDQSSRREN
ncbi:MurR/RpiR family transcriptional regulator [Pseudobutyrivibrio sp.]|uniref:MurR/RpiR family transcriptional regulator n=1 Tax=Pseudobutyrivibrio sp. TaxID=2014367 RepID=UPI0025D81C8F|nr:hypothetical protein [Pseudobutyrivibrio sp.]